MIVWLDRVNINYLKIIFFNQNENRVNYDKIGVRVFVVGVGLRYADVRVLRQLLSDAWGGLVCCDLTNLKLPYFIQLD